MERGIEELIAAYYREGVKQGFFLGVSVGFIVLTAVIAFIKVVL